jgi:hypothetical protein
MTLTRHPFAALALCGLMGAFSVQAVAQTTPAAPAAPAAQPRPAAPAAQGNQPRPGQPARQTAQPRVPETPTRIPLPGFGELPLFGSRVLEQEEIGFRMTIPAGWIADGASPQGQDGVIARMIMEGPGSPSPSCVLNVLRNQIPPRLTQAQVNTALHRDENIANLRRTLGAQGRRVNEVRRVTRTGVAGLQARVTVPGNASRPDVALFLTFFEALGRRFNIECQVLAADLQSHQPDIEAIFTSLEILPRRTAEAEAPAAAPAARPAQPRPAQPAAPRQ